MALEREQARDLANDKGVARDVKSVAQERIVGGVGEGFDLESAEDAGVILRFADACGEIKSGHCVGGAEEVCGELGSVSFGSGEKGVGEVSLERAEGRAMDVVDDDGNVGAGGGDASEDSSFAAVGVDDVGLLCFEQSRQVLEREEIFQRMNRADEGGDDCEKGIVGNIGH